MQKKLLWLMTAVIIIVSCFFLIRHFYKSIPSNQKYQSSATAQPVSAEKSSCLERFLPSFKDDSVVIIGVSNYKQEDFATYYRKVDLNKAICKTTFSEIQQFINRHFKTMSHGSTNVIQSWNYLSLNETVIYDRLASLKSEEGDESDKALVFEANDNLYLVNRGYDTQSYSLNSIINDNLVCYQYYYETFGGAYPDSGTSYRCQDIHGKLLAVTDLIQEKELVKQIVQDPDVKEFLKKYKMHDTDISSFNDLYNSFIKDDEVKCAIGDKMSLDAFVVTKQNPDGTIDITYNPFQNAIHACRAASFGPFELKNLPPKITIHKFVLPIGL
jgi:hypothetical protein